MHPTTRAVRALYEQYPYPAGPPSLRIGFDVRRTLASVQIERPDPTIRVLDAGCSRGNGLLGMAQAQPDVDFLGVDVNPVALEIAATEARRRGLTNVRFAEVDLETGVGLEPPGAGFDVIICSGVLHHLLDPTHALRQLTHLLAPWGVLDLMVYAREGRIGLERVAAEVAVAVPADLPLAERVRQVRTLVNERAADPSWAEISSLPDAEVADRYLHPHFVSYTLEELGALIASAGQRVARWTDLTRWDPARTPGPPPRMYDVLLSRAPARRPSADPETDGWALNPEGELRAGTRHLWSGTRHTGYSWFHPSREGALSLHAGTVALAADFLANVGRPFYGSELTKHLGVPREETRQILRALEARDILWRPHGVDLHARADLPRLSGARLQRVA